MKYAQIEMLPISPVRIGRNPSCPIPGANDLVTFLCHAGGACDEVNRQLSAGWELIQFVTHHSAEKDATAVVAILGKPWGYDDTPIDTLGLSNRAENILKAEDIFTLEELTSKTEVDLLKLNHMGKRTLVHIKERLRAHDKHLRSPS